MGDRMGQAGELNPNWRGGRVIDPRGYTLVRQPEHPRADVRGYVYEHYLIAERLLGRALQPGETVRRKRSSEPFSEENIIVRTPPANPDVACACGCGAVFARYDAEWRQRRYLPGHNAERRHPDTLSPIDRRRERERLLGKITAEDRAEAMETFGGQCAYGCGRAAVSIDHVMPISLGGATVHYNLVPACKPCNSAKSNRSPVWWVYRGSLAFPDQWAHLMENEISLFGTGWMDEEIFPEWEAFPLTEAVTAS